MDTLLSLIPKSAYPQLEKHLKVMLAEVSREVDHTHRYHVIADMHKKRMDSMAEMCRKVAALPDDEAIAAICALPSAPCAEVAAFHLKLARKKIEAEDRAKRNRRIAILARKGKTNAEIARAVGVSYSTAAKEAAKALRGEMP